MTYSKELNKLINIKKYSQIRAKEKRLKTAIYSQLMDSLDQDLPHNQFITLARPALPSLETSALPRFQKFCRVLRDQANALGRGFSYLWVAGVGAKRGYHIHMTLYWPYRRRTFSSLMSEHSDFSESLVDSLLNHKRSATRQGVMRHYQHAKNLKQRREVMEWWCDFLEREVING